MKHDWGFGWPYMFVFKFPVVSFHNSWTFEWTNEQAASIAQHLPNNIRWSIAAALAHRVETAYTITICGIQPQRIGMYNQGTPWYNYT